MDVQIVGQLLAKIEDRRRLLGGGRTWNRVRGRGEIREKRGEETWGASR